jgi:hypothetical protein
VCGQFGATLEFLVDSDIRDEVHPYLSAATRKAYSSGGQPIVLTTKNWKELEEQQRSTRVSEKLDRLLRLFAEHSDAPGGTWNINIHKDYPLVSALNPAELAAYLNHLAAKGYLASLETYGRTFYELTVAGWQQLEPILTPGGVPGRCFVAMWFDDSMDTSYNDGIALGVKDAGFQPYRVKEDPTNKASPI